MQQHNAWRPDWHQIMGYPNGETTTDRQWAWEFLRRNLVYQSDFTEAHNLSTDCTKELREKYWIKKFVDPAVPYSYKLGRSLWEDASYIFGPRMVSYSDRPHFDERWEGMDERVWHNIRTPQSDTEVVVKFDIGLPIKPQLEEAESRLEIYKSVYASTWAGDKTGQRSIYRGYLRVLDAESEGLSLLKMAEVFLQANDPDWRKGNDRDGYDADRKAMDYRLKIAKHMCVDGYRSLSLTPDKFNFDEEIAMMQEIEDS